MYRRPQQSWNMPGRLKFNSVVLMALAGLFVFTIYNLARLRVPPFGLDPCDAVMNFAIFTMALALAGSHEHCICIAPIPYLMRKTRTFFAPNTRSLLPHLSRSWRTGLPWQDTPPCGSGLFGILSYLSGLESLQSLSLQWSRWFSPVGQLTDRYLPLPAHEP